MTESPQSTTSSTASSSSATTIDLKTLTHIAYGLFAVGILSMGAFGAAAVAAVILLFVKRADAAGTVYALHFDWMLYTFWWGALWFAVSALATLVHIGWVGVVATGVWVIYRLIKGWLALYESRTVI
jgi:uncharacterized membrane protein